MRDFSKLPSLSLWHYTCIDLKRIKREFSESVFFTSLFLAATSRPFASILETGLAKFAVLIIKKLSTLVGERIIKWCGIDFSITPPLHFALFDTARYTYITSRYRDRAYRRASDIPWNDNAPTIYRIYATWILYCTLIYRARLRYYLFQ